jgi:hypothetical protein
MSFRKLTMAAVAAVSLSVAAAPADAATVLVFGQKNVNDSLLVATNPGTPGGSNGGTALSVNAGAIEVTAYLGATPTPFDAFLTLAASSVTTASATGPVLLQEFAGTFSINSLADGTGVNYLSGTFSNATFSAVGVAGSIIGGTLMMGGTSLSGAVTFASDVIPSNLLQPERGITFSFTNASPALTALCPTGADPTVCAFTSNLSGNMSANVGTVVPVPASLALLGVGLFALGAAVRRKAA